MTKNVVKVYTDWAVVESHRSNRRRIILVELDVWFSMHASLQNSI